MRSALRCVDRFKEVRSLFALIARSVPDFLGVLLCYMLVIVVWATVGLHLFDADEYRAM